MGTLTIDLDDAGTWPRVAVQRLREARQNLLAYRDACRRHVFGGGGSSNFPTCPTRDRLVPEIDRAAADCDLLGYHCTRFSDAEISDVRRLGLAPLSTDLLSRRVNAAVQRGELDASAGEGLKTRNFVDDESRGRRLNMIWMVFSKETLKDEGGLRCLFGYWGGEAVYAAQSEAMRRVLRTLGSACIVEVVVPVSWLTDQRIGERLVHHYEWLEGGRPGEGDPGFESSVTQPIPASRVRRVITDREADFEMLTARSCWAPIDGKI